MSPDEKFKREVAENIQQLGALVDLQSLSMAWMLRAGVGGNYTYNFSWMGRPIIQFPQDICALQELIWKIKPDLIIETGIAHGGSLILTSSMLSLLDYCDAVEKGVMLDPKVPNRRVLGLDIDIRSHNRKAIEAHPMANRIDMIEGSSIDPAIIEQVREIASNYERVLVCLDSNHTHDHVLAELEAYAPLVSQDSYCIVFDTLIENMPEDLFSDRPWGPGESPKTAVREYLQMHPEFVIDKQMNHKLLISVAPDGYLKKVGRG